MHLEAGLPTQEEMHRTKTCQRNEEWQRNRRWYLKSSADFRFPRTIQPIHFAAAQSIQPNPATFLTKHILLIILPQMEAEPILQEERTLVKENNKMPRMRRWRAYDKVSGFKLQV